MFRPLFASLALTATIDSIKQACSIYSCTILAADFTHYRAKAYFCRSQPACPGGSEDLVAGQIVRVSFELDPKPIAVVRAEFFWNGAKLGEVKWEPPPPTWSGRFYLTDPGLGYRSLGGKLEMKLWVGDILAGEYEATVRPPPVTQRRYRILAPSVSSDGVR